MKRNAKKIAALILVTVLMLSLGITAAADDYSGHWAKEYIDFVKENGYWTDTGDFQPDKPITRAEFSAMFVRTLKAAVVEIVPSFDDVNANTPYAYEIHSAYEMGLIKGDGKNFYPNNTITRQEAAAILDRASFMIFGKEIESDVNKGRFIDYDKIDDWARKYVFNVLESGLMSGPTAKTFNPLGTLTRAETATICKRITQLSKLDKLNYSVRKADKGEEKNFPVLNSGITDVMYGISGWAVLARFEKGPGEVYFSRTTKNDEKLDKGAVWDSSPIAKVLDPDGNMVGVYPFEWIHTGTESIVMKINCEKSGIYTIQVMNGRTNDYFEIGIKEPVSWGIRAEKRLKVTSTFLKEGYIYTQRTNDYIYVGGSTTHPIKLLDLDGKTIATSTEVSRRDTKQDLITYDAEPNTVYQLKFDPAFNGMMMTDGFPGVISPTPEMAEDLKGGWFDQDGVVTQGPLQMRARKRAVEIAKNENLNVVINKPAEIPRDIQNPLAEAQMFGVYGVISGVGAACARQIIDPESKYLGYIVDATIYTGEKELPETSYEACHFDNRMREHGGMASAISLPFELNFAYGNKALVNRLSLALLHYVVELGEVYEDRQQDFIRSQNSVTSMFDYDHFIESYKACEKFFDTETREILYQAVIAVGNKMSDYPGQGVTNQAFFHATNNLRLYILTGCDPTFEFLHDMYKKQITTLMRDDIYGWHLPYHRGYGFHEGHFIENGFDSSYEYMNREEWVQTYLEYRACKNADPVLVEKMEAITQEMLEFETYFTLPQPGNEKFNLANAFTSRKANEFGSGNQPSYEKLFHDMPIAALRWKFKQQGDTLNFSETYPQIINTEEWAWDHIEEFYPAYENYFTPESNRWGNYWPQTTYEAFNAGRVADSSGLELPCFQEDGVKLNTSEVVAVKHKGLYLMNVYQNVHSYRPTYSMVGGAPLMIWSENTGVVERSKKIYGSTEKYITPDEALLMHASVYGMAGGQFFHSGKEGHEGYGSSEPCTLKWIEEGKKYEISGRIPDTDIIITWTYDLTDTGIDMNVKVKGTVDSDSIWLNFPINGQDEKGKTEFDAAAGKLDYIYDGGNGHMRFTWDAANESKFLDVIEESMNLKRLRIKIPTGGLTMHIEAVK